MIVTTIQGENIRVTKKLMSVMLGLSLAMGSAVVVFGQDKAPAKQDSKDKAPTKQDSRDKK